MHHLCNIDTALNYLKAKKVRLYLNESIICYEGNEKNYL